MLRSPDNFPKFSVALYFLPSWPVYSIIIVVTLYIMSLDNFPKFSVALYFLQSWPVYSGDPVYNGHLAISQG